MASPHERDAEQVFPVDNGHLHEGDLGLAAPPVARAGDALALAKGKACDGIDREVQAAVPGGAGRGGGGKRGVCVCVCVCSVRCVVCGCGGKRREASERIVDRDEGTASTSTSTSSSTWVAPLRGSHALATTYRYAWRHAPS